MQLQGRSGPGWTNRRAHRGPLQGQDCLEASLEGPSVIFDGPGTRSNQLNVPSAASVSQSCDTIHAQLGTEPNRQNRADLASGWAAT